MKPEHPKEIPGVRKYSGLKFLTKHDYIPIMTGSIYAVSMTHLEHHRALHPDVHILFIKIQEEQPDTVTAIMTQLSLKSIFKEWVTKYHNSVHSKIKQLNLRNKFKPMHWK